MRAARFMLARARVGREERGRWREEETGISLFSACLCPPSHRCRRRFLLYLCPRCSTIDGSLIFARGRKTLVVSSPASSLPPPSRDKSASRIRFQYNRAIFAKTMHYVQTNCKFQLIETSRTGRSFFASRALMRGREGTLGRVEIRRKVTRENTGRTIEIGAREDGGRNDDGLGHPARGRAR